MQRNIADRRSDAHNAFEFLPKLISTVGDHQFGGELIDFLGEICQADHFTFFRIEKDQPFFVFAFSQDGTDTARRQFSLYLSKSYWRTDPSMAATIRLSSPAEYRVMHTSVDTMRDPQMRDILYGAANVGERIMLCGRRDNVTLGLSILRSQNIGLVTSDQLSCLESLASTLLSMLSKHMQLSSSYIDSSIALTTLPEIEATLDASDVPFSRREIEVGARVLYGISTTGIALDLGIGEETVATYRKRSYQRLGIGTQRELLVWYLHEWSRGHCGPSGARSLQFGSTERLHA